ncbi:hypothetical protein L226DRAFT_128327 [Lentinus tigrinus ALCF2SS1-7]|uniref:Uncharacterized protein n=1 Tax=Lentinus tigrinus ALCF2SS1-6 TaxID=1328759 RepID=A0A5C2STY8_9APHY|nr:hypothetical protein L227DRAFT_605533 [Lentinus tigrinus ALCF2SS1-6]RPD81063.1 hypothetical protein L226DRAFT_128327 [Lentinus tigrinus ALCF2SS1-7]
MVSLPIAVVRMIMEHTGERRILSSRDMPTLSSCSLVCRAWKDPAQALLYRMVILDSDQRYDHFRDFLQSTPHIAAHIRYFGITRSYHDTYPLPPFLLLEILELLPHIDTVELTDVTVLGWPGPFTPYPEEGPFRLRRLVVSGTTVGPYFNQHCMRFDFLRLFALDELACYGNADDEDLTHTLKTNRRGVPHPRVRRLEIVGRDCFLDFNEKSGGGLDPDALSALEIESEDDAGVRYAGRYLKRYARTIRHVGLDLCFFAHKRGSKKQSAWKGYNIDACVGLETLTLHLRPKDDWRDNAEQCAKAYSAILEQTPPTLKELTLAIWQTSKAEGVEELAPHIAQLVTQAMARFTGLERLVLQVQMLWEVTLEQFKDILRKHLPADVVDDDLVHYKTVHTLAPHIDSMKFWPLRPFKCTFAVQ